MLVIRSQKAENEDIKNKECFLDVRLMDVNILEK